MEARIFLALAAFFLMGCEPNDVSATPSPPAPIRGEKSHTGPAVGWVNGQKWQFETGRAFIKSQGYQEFLIVELWNEPLTIACDAVAGSTLQIKLKSLPEVGEWPIGRDSFRNIPRIFFMDMKEPVFGMNTIIADSGMVAVDELGPFVKGRFVGQFSNPSVPRTEAKGSFSVPYCAEIEVL